MTDPAPDPLTPPDCDVRSMPDMLLDVSALLKSDFAAHSNADVFRYGLFAWCVAFHEVPAGSLPDDDAIIARLVGLGRDPGAGGRFAALRNHGALHGFIKCSDGRLYHPVVAQKALAAWDAKGENKARTEAARAARRAKAAGRHEANVTNNVTAGAKPNVTVDVTVEKSATNKTEQNRTEGNVRKDNEAPASAAAVAGAEEFQIPEWVPKKAWDDFIAMRKKLRKAPTERAKELIVLELAKLHDAGDDVGGVLDQSTRKSWQDVFPLDKEINRGKTAFGNSFAATLSEVVRERARDRMFDLGREVIDGNARSGSSASRGLQNLIAGPAVKPGGE